MRIPGLALIVLGTISVAVLPARQLDSPPSGTPASAPVTAPTDGPIAMPSAGRVFASEAGAVLSTVRADKVAEFETVIGRVHHALAQATGATRRAQAAGWKVFRATEAGPSGSVLYVFVMDPAVKDADYTISGILREAFPAEVQALFEQYNGAILSQSLLSLTAVARFGEPFTPPVRGRQRAPGAVPAPRQAPPDGTR